MLHNNGFYAMLLDNLLSVEANYFINTSVIVGHFCRVYIGFYCALVWKSILKCVHEVKLRRKKYISF